MSFGEQKGNNATAAAPHQPNGKRPKVNGRPSTSSGSGSQGNKNIGQDAGPVGVAFSELHNQRQMLFHEREQHPHGKVKNLTEHSIDRVHEENPIRQPLNPSMAANKIVQEPNSAQHMPHIF